MSVIKPSIPKGTRDFTPIEVAKRQYIFGAIKKVFEKYGYQPIETPTMENLSTLEGKYGEEGDKLLFRILNSGEIYDALSKTTVNNNGDVIKALSEKGLRYDLTVPFARFVVMHQNDITFPFKRYQIQPVWRADRPQRGRYREFYQCDADVVGSDSLVYEMELVKIYDEVFGLLGIPVAIKLNNRKVLSGMAESIGAQQQFMDITIAIDKLDKIGQQGVRQELNTKGITESQMQVIEKFFAIKGTPGEMISKAKELLSDSPTGLKGLNELETVLNYLQLSGSLKQKLEIDFSLARGLNYYTGAIIEVKPTNVQMGSLGGGGRYDDLTGMFGLKGISGVGVSFGADRIYDVLEELKLFPESAISTTKVLFVTFDDAALQYALPLLQQVRAEGISSEIYPSPDKLKKQMKYANDKQIPFVIVIGEDEVKSGKLSFKNMTSGEQELLDINEIIQRLK
jgi:histidyl-tRNA synthetase